MIEFRALDGTLPPLSGIPRLAASLILTPPTALEVVPQYDVLEMVHGASLDQIRSIARRFAACRRLRVACQPVREVIHSINETTV